MEELNDESQNALFVYFQDDMHRFWVYDGQRYLHFAWPDSGARFVRAQDYLPGNTMGVCVPMSVEQRAWLEAEAARFDLHLPFFDSEDACNQFALASRQEQYIIDRTLPAGYFYLDGGMKRRLEDGDME